MDTRTVGPDRHRSLRPVVVVLVAVAISAGVLVGTVIGTREAAAPPAAAPLFLERVDTPGADPFVPVAQPAPRRQLRPGLRPLPRTDARVPAGQRQERRRLLRLPRPLTRPGVY